MIAFTASRQTLSGPCSQAVVALNDQPSAVPLARSARRWRSERTRFYEAAPQVKHFYSEYRAAGAAPYIWNSCWYVRVHARPLSASFYPHYLWPCGLCMLGSVKGRMLQSHRRNRCAV